MPSSLSPSPHLRLGIQLPEVERTVRWPEYLDLARRAEDLGFDSVWVGDHLLYRGDDRPERGPQEAWTLLAAIAAVTNRVAFGPLVACTAFHPPGIIAKMASTIDEISGGRLILGLGAGWNEPEFRAFGIPFDHRASRFEEAFTAIRKLTAGERCTLHGRFHDLDDAVVLPPPLQPVTLMVGSTGDRVLETALPHVHWWNTWYDWYGNTVAGFARLNETISARVEASGRSSDAVHRSACVFLIADPAATERISAAEVAGISLDDLADHLRGLADAGADEAILVVNPINAWSMSRIAEVLTAA
ncbi:MAG: LLM class flavin-dependent oxidoreductase [Ilumatobacteraceae bacterium]